MSYTSTLERAKPRLAVDHRKLGMWLFLASEVMFFSGFIAAFIHHKVRDPAASSVLDVGFTAVNTSLLLTSSFTMVMALASLRRRRLFAVWNFLLLTAVLGGGFLFGQSLEFEKLIRNGVSLHTIFGSTFFCLTGFHGFHVFIGLLWCAYVMSKVFRFQVTGPEHALTLELFGLYWHFVDVVWIILFTIIYLIR
jgi:cytochrome c oxidase subunit 3